MMTRFARNWVYGGALAGLLLLALAPLFLVGWPTALVAVFLQLPVYMLHQYEEHDDNRFGRFLAELFGDGRAVLSPLEMFVVNIPGVWGINLVSIWLAASVGLGFGLIGVYLTLVNAMAHIGQGVALRRYNPGLATAVLLFLPLGLWAFGRFRLRGWPSSIITRSVSALPSSSMARSPHAWRAIAADWHRRRHDRCAFVAMRRGVRTHRAAPRFRQAFSL